MDKIYMDAKDKNVAKVVIYYNSSNDSANAPFLDEECTIPFPNDELCDAFVKGAILRDVGDGRYYNSLATGCYIDNNSNIVHLFGSTHSGAELVVPAAGK